MDILGGTYTVKCGGLKLEGGTVRVDILGGSVVVCLRRMEWTSLEVLIPSSVVV